MEITVGGRNSPSEEGNHCPREEFTVRRRKSLSEGGIYRQREKFIVGGIPRQDGGTWFCLIAPVNNDSAVLRFPEARLRVSQAGSGTQDFSILGWLIYMRKHTNA
eukprot:1312792-Pyramimonas_sp.AAC.1